MAATRTPFWHPGNPDSVGLYPVEAGPLPAQPGNAPAQPGSTRRQRAEA